MKKTSKIRIENKVEAPFTFKLCKSKTMAANSWNTDLWTEGSVWL